MAIVDPGNSILFIDGKEIGPITGTSAALSPAAESEWEPHPVTLSLAFKVCKEANEAFKRLHEEIAKQRAEMIREVNAWVEDCLRTRVTPPIKGEITKGKIRNRGLALCYGPDGEFIGVLQHRQTLYHVDGNVYNSPKRIKMNMRKEDKVKVIIIPTKED